MTLSNKELKKVLATKTLSQITNAIATVNAVLKALGSETRVSLTTNKEKKEYHSVKKTGATVLNQLGFSVRYNGTDNGLEISVEKFASFKFDVQPNANGGNTVSATYKGKRMSSLMVEAQTEVGSYAAITSTYKMLDGFVKDTLKMESRNLADMVEDYKFTIAKRLYNACMENDIDFAGLLGFKAVKAIEADAIEVEAIEVEAVVA